MLNKLKTENKVEEDKFHESISDFYETGIKYLKMWESRFDKADKFTCLTLQNEVTWPELEENGLTVNSVIAGSVNMDELFDERALLCKILSKQKPEWDSLPEEKRPTTQDKWMTILDVFSKSNVFTNIFKIVEFAMCLPGTSAPAKRVFSVMENIWSAERKDCQCQLLRNY